MNIIITGPKHCGKSTIINKLIGSYQGSISGFISEFDDRSSGTRELRIRNISGSLSRCAVRWMNGPYEILPETFDTFASDLININSNLIIFDELGKFEKNCSRLETAVKDAFDSPNPVVASIRFDAEGWMQELKNRSDVVLIKVDNRNRNAIPAYIIETLTNNCWNR